MLKNKKKQEPCMEFSNKADSCRSLMVTVQFGIQWIQMALCLMTRALHSVCSANEQHLYPNTYTMIKHLVDVDRPGPGL